MYPYLNTERIWTLVYENNARQAIFSVYLAAMVLNPEFQRWNLELLAMIESEMTLIKGEGYSVTLIGDFNCHIGNENKGVLGNRGDINFNGQLVRNFVSNNDLTLINSIKSLCTGIFSRTANGSSSLLDLAMADVETMDRVISLEVDETNVVFKGSDHSALLLEISTRKQEKRLSFL